MADSITRNKLEHSNILLEVRIQELEEQNQQGPENPGKAYYHSTDKAKGSELVNAKNSEPHKWEPGKGTFQEWRSLVEDHAERTHRGYKQTL